MEPPREWLTHQLSEFLAGVSSMTDEAAARRGGILRVAEAVEAEIGALVVGDDVVNCIGFRPGSAESAQLLDIPTGSSEVTIASLGPAYARVAPMEIDDVGPDARVVLVRVDAPFTAEENSLIRGMVRVLGLTLRLLRVLESERRSRRAVEHEASEKQTLLASLQERQAVLERLFEIQRSISHRAPAQVVLDSITKATAELMQVDVAAVRLVDESDPSYLQIRSIVGADEEVVASVKRSRVGVGVGGEAFAEGKLVEAADYPARANAHREFVDDGLGSAMAAPVHRNGAVVGSLVVGRNRRGAYSDAERQMLLALAEHTSLALNDFSALDAIQRAYDDAVHRANHDELTGLPNRALVLDRIETAARREARAGNNVCVLFIDLDRFKSINDSLGHSIGDEVLVTVAQRLEAAIRAEDTVGRLSGDEFVVVCEDLQPHEAIRFAERIASALAEPIRLYGRELVLAASIGIASGVAPLRAEDLIRDADVAMYRAKGRGTGAIELFDEAIRAAMIDRIEMEHDLRRAIPNGDLRLHYQPIVDTISGTTFAVEALVRWEHPTRGLLFPDTFVPLAEDAGLIVALGGWVVREACEQVARWRLGRSPLADVRVSVNLSARQFADPGLVDLVETALREADVPAASLSLEITESVLMEDAETAVETLRELHRLGIHLAIDDFGTGYSSLAYLQLFPVDTIKIDRSFIQSMDTGNSGRIIVDAVVSLARALDLGVIAEGVETEAQLHELRRLRCHAVQGFLFGRPVAPDALTAHRDLDPVG